MAPNILLLFPDQWRYDWAGFDPDRAPLKMPNLQKLASEGTRYTHAYTPSPWCVPARACLASVSRYGEQSGSAPNVVNGHDFPMGTPTWYQSMQKVGYHVIAVGKDDLCQSIQGTSADGSRHAADVGFSSYYRSQDKFATFAFKQAWDQYGTSLQQEKCGRNESGAKNLRDCNQWCYGAPFQDPSRVGKCCKPVAGESKDGFNCPGLDQVGSKQELYIDDLMTAKAVELLDAAPAGKPWVLHLSFPGPHPPFIITEGMNKSMAGRTFPASFDNTLTPRKEQLEIRMQYAAEIENLDSLFGKIMQKLQDRGEADNTYVLVMSDHGEMLGDHNWWGKKVPWEASVRVPLIVRGPGVTAGSVVDTPVSTLSAINFVLDKAGAQKEPHWYQVPLPTAASTETPPIESGLSVTSADFRIVVQKFNSSCVLKVVCCPYGCPPGNSKVPSTFQPQLIAFNVAADPEESVDLGYTEEARTLAGDFSEGYGTKCLQDATISYADAHRLVASLPGVASLSAVDSVGVELHGGSGSFALWGAGCLLLALVALLPLGRRMAPRFRRATQVPEKSEASALLQL